MQHISGKPQLINDTYQLGGVVVEETNGVTVIETTDGNIWETYTVDGVSVGDDVMLILDGHDTTDVTDDTIIGIETMVNLLLFSLCIKRTDVCISVRMRTCVSLLRTNIRFCIIFRTQLFDY